ncbi:MAG: hypothetical protein ACYCSO_08770 [Cuniculiplasma sp.]
MEFRKALALSIIENTEAISYFPNTISTNFELTMFRNFAIVTALFANIFIVVPIWVLH